MFRVLTPIIRSSYSCNYSFWQWSTGLLPSALVVESLLSSNSTTRADGSRTGCPLPVAVITVVRVPDDGCQHAKRVELSTDI